MSQFYVGVNSGNIPPNIPTSFVTNSGTATPAANTINILTANSTPQFQGSGNTITLDFGLSNLVLGSSSPNITSGNSNVGFGQGSLALFTTGSDNTAIGWASGASLTTGTNNTLVGLAAGGNLTTTNGTVAIGVSALQDATGQHNTSVGYNSLADITTGTENIALGFQAGLAYKSSESSNIIIGNAGQLNDQNTIRIGVSGVGSGQQSTCYIAGIAGVTVSNLQVVTINTLTGQLGSQASIAATSIIGTANQILANGTSGAAQTGMVTLTTPQDIATTSSVSFNSVKTGNGLVSAAAYGFTAAANTGMYRNAGNGIGFAVAGVNYLDISSAGLVLMSGSATVTNRLTTATLALGYTSGAGNLVDAGSASIYGFTDTSAPRTMILAIPSIAGRIITVKDQSGGAATNNITVSVSGGATIDGAATFVMNTNYGSASFYDNGSSYFVM